MLESENRNISSLDVETNIPKEITAEIRLGFIRKVYGILSFQLLLTTLMCIISMTSITFQNFQMNNMWLFYLNLVLIIALPIIGICFPQILRKTPDGYVFLACFTVLMGYLVSFVCGISEPKIVLMAAAMTCSVTIALTIYAWTTKTDFTILGSTLFICLTALIMFSFFAMFTDNEIIHIFLASAGLILFGFYLVYDTQLIVGNHENKLSMDDYILGSLMLYLDIINIFLKILRLLNSGNRR